MVEAYTGKCCMYNGFRVPSGSCVFPAGCFLSHGGKQVGIRVSPRSVDAEKHAGSGIVIRVQIFHRGNVISDDLRMSAFEIIHSAFAKEIGGEFPV